MVFYFSGTGNSKYIAKRIAQELKEDVFSITDFLNNNEMELNFKITETIGIIFPTYYYGFPIIIKKFFDYLTIMKKNNKYINNKYLYIIYSYEGYSGGIESKIFSLLQKKDLNLKYISSVKMPNNFSIYYNLPSIEKEKDILNLAELKINEIIKDIKLRKENKVNKNIIRKIITLLMYPIYKYGRKTKRFYADNKCINCELCEKICPVNAIKMKNQKPEWIKNQCEYCLACYNRCPVNAIQIGNWTLNRRRYYNPNLDNIED